MALAHWAETVGRWRFSSPHFAGRDLSHDSSAADGDLAEKVVVMLEQLLDGQARVEALLKQRPVAGAEPMVHGSTMAAAACATSGMCPVPEDQHPDVMSQEQQSDVEPGSPQLRQQQLLKVPRASIRKGSDDGSEIDDDRDSIAMDSLVGLGEDDASGQVPVEKLETFASMAVNVMRLCPRDERGHSGSGLIRVPSMMSLVRSGEGGNTSLESIDRYILHPHSHRRVALDIVGLFLLVYDSMQLPYHLAWDIQLQGPSLVFGWITFAFWVFDTIMGFFSGYYKKGRAIMCRRKIISHYLRTDFLPYALALCTDCAALVLATNSLSRHETSTALGKSLRLLRLPRILRILSAFKAGRIRKYYEDFVRNSHFGSHWEMSATVSKLVLLMLWVCHLVACIFRSVEVGSMQRYYDGVGLDSESFAEAPNLEYMQYYYWAVNALIAATSITAPATHPEMAVTVISLLTALLGCSLVIAIIGDTLLDYRDVNKHRNDAIAALRRYLNQSHVPTLFAGAIERQASHSTDRARIVEEDVELLKNLSPAMSEALLIQVFRPAVRSQVFIRACDGSNQRCTRDVCASALERAVKHPGDFSFRRGEDAVGAHFVYWGDFEYMKPTVVNSSAGVKTHQEDVARCCWVCELALFCRWEHFGSMRAKSLGEVLVIDGKSFTTMLQQDMHLAAMARDYANALCAEMKRSPESVESELALPVAHAEILALMHHGARASMSKAGVDLAGRRNLFLYGGELNEKVKDGHCDLVVRGAIRTWDAPLEEQVVHVVTAVSLQVWREDGRVLVKLGHLTRDGIEPDFGIPGKRSRKVQAPMKALEKLLSGPLAEMKDVITVKGKEKVEEEEEEESIAVRGIPTRCIRHTFTGTVDESWLATGSRRELEWEVLSPRPAPSRPAPSRPAPSRPSRSYSGAGWMTQTMTKGIGGRAGGDRDRDRSGLADQEAALSLVPGAFVLADDDPEGSPPVFAWMMLSEVQQPEHVAALESFMRRQTHRPSLSPAVPADLPTLSPAVTAI